MGCKCTKYSHASPAQVSLLFTSTYHLPHAFSPGLCWWRAQADREVAQRRIAEHRERERRQKEAMLKQAEESKRRRHIERLAKEHEQCAPHRKNLEPTTRHAVHRGRHCYLPGVGRRLGAPCGYPLTHECVSMVSFSGRSSAPVCQNWWLRVPTRGLHPVSSVQHQSTFPKHPWRVWVSDAPHDVCRMGAHNLIPQFVSTLVSASNLPSTFLQKMPPALQGSCCRAKIDQRSDGARAVQIR